MFTVKEKEYLNKQLKATKGTKKRQLVLSENGRMRVSAVGEKRLKEEIELIQGIEDKINNN